MRYRAGIVIYCPLEKKILLIRRKKPDREYWVVPGGGLEAHESYEQAAVRELREELELPVRQMSELCTINLDNSTEKYFISYSDSCGKVEMHGEELKRSAVDNIYEPVWVDVSNIQRITLLPVELKKRLQEMNWKG